MGHEPAFADLLRRYRLATGVTQGDLAARANLSERGMSDLERGARRTPHRDTVLRLADALELRDGERAALLAAARRQPSDRKSPSVERSRASLPLPLTSFIGREHECAEVRRMVAEKRLVTLTGPGGVGKTRLALAVGTSAEAQFADGVQLIDLAPLSEPGPLASVVASSLGIAEKPAQSASEVLVTALVSRTMLLILDNCEHLVEQCASLVFEVLGACPGVRVLATSREPLRVPGEHIWHVPPLKTPTPANLPHSTAELRECPSVRLFVDRARAVQPDFEVTPTNSSAVAQICARVEGLPLAPPGPHDGADRQIIGAGSGRWRQCPVSAIGACASVCA